MTTKQQIRHFILDNFLFTNDPSKLADEESLLESGVLDSTGVLELILFIEERFGLKVAHDEMTPANLDSVEHIAAYLDRKQLAKRCASAA